MQMPDMLSIARTASDGRFCEPLMDAASRALAEYLEDCWRIRDELLDAGLEVTSEAMGDPPESFHWFFDECRD
jgi:hypothetical protein